MSARSMRGRQFVAPLRNLDPEDLEALQAAFAKPEPTEPKLEVVR